MELTATQHKVLVTLAVMFTKNDYTPSSREVCSALDLASTNSLAIHLKALKKKGAVDWEENLSRTVRLTQEAWVFLLGRELASRRENMSRSIIGRLQFTNE